jgi:hypothetical protein
MKPIVCRKINGAQDKEDQKKATKEEHAKCVDSGSAAYDPSN